MNEEILKSVTEEMGLLCKQGKYNEAYTKCELVYIQFSDYVEWYSDNHWHKGGTWKGKQKGEHIYKKSISFVEVEKHVVQEILPAFEGVRIRKRIAGKKKDEKSKTEKEEQKKEEEEIDVSVKMPLLLMDWFAVSAYHVGNHHRSFYICYKLIQTEFCEKAFELNRVKNNASHCIPKIKDRLQFYPEDIIAEFDKINFEGRIPIYIEYSPKVNLVINSIINAMKDLYILKLPFIIITDQQQVEVTDFEYKFVSFIHIDDLKYEYPHLFIQKDTSFFCRRNYIKTPMNILIENSSIDVVLFNQAENQKSLFDDTISEYRKTLKNKKFLLKKEMPNFKTTGLYKRSFETIRSSATFISNHYTF
jgi:hypothetical protein